MLQTRLASTLTAFVLPLCALSLASAADPAALEARLQALEEKIMQISQENAVLKKQLGLDAKSPAALVTAAGKETKLSIGGYLQGQAEFGDAPDSRFVAGDRIYARRARLTVKGSFVEHFGFTLQSEFGSNTTGAASGLRAQATDVFVNWTRYDAANITVGQFKTPYGYEQLLPDTKVLTIERSLPNDRLTLSRQLGAMVSGTVAEKRLSYAAGAFNGNGINTSTNDNDQFMYVGRVAGTAVKADAFTLALGTGAFTSRDTGSFTGRRDGLAFDAQATWGRAGLLAEHFRTHFDRDSGVDTDASGWSVLGTYFVVPKTLQALVRYETYDPNRAVAADETDVWTVGLNYFLKGDDLKLSVNYLLGDAAGATGGDAGRLLTRVQVVF